MGKHALGSGETVNCIPDMRHFFWRDDGFPWIGSRRGADEPDGSVAVQKDFFDVVFQAQVFHRSTIAGELGIQAHLFCPPSQAQESLFPARLVKGGTDVVRLHIEDERDVPFACLNRLGFRRFNVKHIEEFSKHLIHGQKSQGHSTGGFEEIPPVDAEAAAQPFAALVDQPFDLVLFEGLWGRKKFFAGDDLRGKR